MISKVENHILLCSETFYLSIMRHILGQRVHRIHTNEFAHFFMWHFVNIVTLIR